MYRLSFCQLFFHTGKYDNVGVYCHTDAEDDTCDTRQSQSDVKCIQQDQDQLCVDEQGQAGCEARQIVYTAHEQAYNDQTDQTRQKAGADCFLSELRAHNL